MNGHILMGSPIAVDFWTKRNQTLYIHFLSHLHGDHIVGLTSTWTQPIYCSELTAEILNIHHGISESLLNILPLNQRMIINCPRSEKKFCVTAFDANHCPGAVMFYFQGDFGNIFYTGDFRYSSDVMSHHLKDLQGRINCLYVDNTFCSPQCEFPSKEECLSQIIDIVNSHPQHNIVIGIRKLGKEDLLLNLGLAVDETIYVSSERLKIIQLLYSTNIFATVSNAKDQYCRIRTVPFHQVTSAYINDLNSKAPTIAILPSAIFTGLSAKPFSRNPNFYVIPYSDHSSFPELMAFVNILKPSQIFPIVKSKRGPFGTDVSDRMNMSCFKPFLGSATIDESRSCNDNNWDDRIGFTDHLNSDDSDMNHHCCNSLPFTSSFNTNNCPQTSSSQCSNVPVQLKRKTHKSHIHSRKKSLPHDKKRKTAKGICYSDHDQEDNDNFITTGSSHEVCESDHTIENVDKELIDQDHLHAIKTREDRISSESRAVSSSIQLHKSTDVSFKDTQTLSKYTDSDRHEQHKQTKLEDKFIDRLEDLRKTNLKKRKDRIANKSIILSLKSLIKVKK